MASPLNRDENGDRLSPSRFPPPSPIPDPDPLPSTSTSTAATATQTPTPNSDLRPFSRSPHPYHRTGHGETERPRHPAWSRTSSDSGTEADDESTGVLKGLPAPPIRPRKGLRAVEDGESWVLVPGLRSLARARARGQKDVARAAGGGGGGGNKGISQGRRVEVMRRVLEVALVASVGAVVVRPVDVRVVAWVWRKGMYSWCCAMGLRWIVADECRDCYVCAIGERSLCGVSV